uniref:Guanine nucleotide-binding protein subunit beta-like protein 1 n=1 Tax=Cacopsylla melanoneura TaxID=428564 RepID=A0A8D8Q770_9HEMI
MAKTYPPPAPIFTFKGFMSSVHCILVDEDILFAGTQEGKVHLWNLKSFREVFTLSVSTQPILSLHKEIKKCNILIQDKELTVSIWNYNVEEGSNNVSLKQIHCLKRSEPKLSFCKCVLFTSYLESHFNKFGNVIDQNLLNPSPSNADNNSSHLVVPYDSKEITLFSLESRKKMTVIDITKQSTSEISNVIMCIKFIPINDNPYLIICTEEGHLTLYNVKLKYVECRVHLHSYVKDHSTTFVDKEESLDLNMSDVPMAIDFDTKTMRGLVGTNSKNLYCIKLYPVKSSLNQHSESTSVPSSNTNMKIKMVLELKHSGVSCISIKSDKKVFVLSFWDGNGIYIYNWNTMKCISFIDYVYSSIHQLYFYNNNMLAVACDGGKVALWEFRK